MLKKPLAAVAILCLALLAGCGGGDDPPEQNAGPQNAGAAGQQAGDPQAGAGGQAQPGGAGGGQAAAQPGSRQAAGGQSQPAGRARPALGSSRAAAGAGGLESLSSGQPVDTSHIPASAVAATYVHPSRILGSPTLADVPQDEMLQNVIDQLGVDPRNIEQVVSAVMLNETPFGPMPGAGFIVRFNEPYDREQIGGNVFPVEGREEASVGGKTYYHNDDVAVHFADDRTLLVFQPEAAEAMLTPADSSSPLVQALNAVGGGDDILLVAKLTEPMKQQLAQQKQMFAMQAGEAADLPEHFETIVVRGRIDPAITLQVGIETDDPQVAQQLLTQTQQGLQMAKAGLKENREQIAESIPIPGVGGAIVNAADRMLAETKPTVNGRTFELTIKAPEQLNAFVPAAVAMVAEQIRSAQGAAKAAVSRNNLQMMGLAFHNHHDIHGTFPARANFEGDTPLLSWRVHILPLIEEQDLYEQFKLDEPWDSEHNKALLEQMPDVYADQSDSGDAEVGHTRYLAVTGPGTAFEGTEGKRIAAFRDGTSNSVIVIEAAPDQAVPWTKPDDLDISDEGALEKLLSAGENGFMALFADGGARRIGASLDMETLRNLFTIADGNQVQID